MTERPSRRRGAGAARALSLALAAIVSVSAGAAAGATEGEPIPMIVEIRVQDVASALIEAPQLGEEPGVPVTTALEWLEIPFETRAEGRIVEGHLGGRERAFSIRGDDRILYRGQEWELGADEAVWFEGDLFLAPRVFDEVFGVGFDYSQQRLRVSLSRDDELPVYRRQRMERLRRYRAPGIAEIERAEHRFEPRPGPYGGHVLDWRARSPNFARPGEFEGANLNLRYGGEVLGGALEGAARASAQTPFDFRASRATWSRPFDHAALRELRLGGLSSPGPSRRQLVGAMATNAPIYPPQRYGAEDLLVDLPPGAPVEALLGGDLLDHGDVGAEGAYALRAPLRYGHNRFAIRYLDEYGELRTEELLYRVPRELMREGEVYYHLASGLDVAEGDTTLQTGRLAWGLAPWLSVNAGAEVLAGPSEERGATVSPFAGAHLQLDRRAILHLEAAGAGRIGAAFDLVSDGDWRVRASHHEIRAHPVLARTSRRRDTALRLGVPLELFGEPAGIRVRARQSASRQGARDSQVRGTLLLRHRKAGYISTGYDWRGDAFAIEHDRGRGIVRWSRGVPGEWPGGRLRLGTEIEIPSGALRRGDASWSRFFSSLGLRVDLGYRVRSRAGTGPQHQATLSLRRYFDGAWARGSARTSSTAAPRAHAQAGGSVNLSAEDGGLTFHRRDQVGRGRAILRVGEGGVDRGSYAFVLDGRRHAVDENGEVAIESLVRERDYRVFVESTARADPLRTPRLEEFDLAARANRTVVAQIALDENFEFEGAVYREPAPGARRGVGGARFYLAERGGDREIYRSFQDGFLYDYGIPPGAWVLAPDAEQMARRGLVARPESIAIEHGADDGAAVYEGLEFLAGPAEDMTDDALRARIWEALAAGAAESAYSTSRVLARELPGSRALRVGALCELGDAEAARAWRARTAAAARVLAFPAPDREGCAEIFVQVADPADEATHGLPRPEALGSAAPRARPLRLVAIEDLVDRAW